MKGYYMSLICELKKKVSYCVCESLVADTEFVRLMRENNIPIIVVSDARSAVYYAVGISEGNIEMVAVCIAAASSRSAFSGMTEAFYRKLSVVLITLGSCFDYSKELRDGVELHYVIEREACFQESLPLQKTVHIEITKEQNREQKISALSFLTVLKETLNKDDYLYLGSSFEEVGSEFSCKVVKGGCRGCHDGAMSNVLGASLAGLRHRYVGLVNEDEYIRDMNVLGNINMNDKVLYIVVASNPARYCSYAKSLLFDTYTLKASEINTQEMRNLVNNQKRTIVFLTEG